MDNNDKDTLTSFIYNLFTVSDAIKGPEIDVRYCVIQW